MDESDHDTIRRPLFVLKELHKLSQAAVNGIIIDIYLMIESAKSKRYGKEY